MKTQGWVENVCIFFDDDICPTISASGVSLSVIIFIWSDLIWFICNCNCNYPVLWHLAIHYSCAYVCMITVHNEIHYRKLFSPKLTSLHPSAAVALVLIKVDAQSLKCLENLKSVDRVCKAIMSTTPYSLQPSAVSFPLLLLYMANAMLLV